MSVQCWQCHRFTTLNKFRRKRYIVQIIGDRGICSECEEAEQFWHKKIMKRRF